MAKNKKNNANTPDFSVLVNKAMEGDALYKGMLDRMEPGSVNFADDLDPLTDSQLSWLYSNVNGLKDVISAKQDERITQKNMSSPAPDYVKNTSMADQMAAASLVNRTEQADKAAEADARLNGTAPGSGNRATIAQGNLAEDRPLTQNERRSAYDPSLKEADTASVDTLHAEDERVRSGNSNTSTGSMGGSPLFAGSSSASQNGKTEADMNEPSEDDPSKDETSESSKKDSDGLEWHLEDEEGNRRDSWLNRMIFGNNIGSVNTKQIKGAQIERAEKHLEDLSAMLEEAKAKGDKAKIEAIQKRYDEAKYERDELIKRQNAQYEKSRAKSSQEEKEQLARDFLKNNPSMGKAIFSSKSGKNIGERLAMLGEWLANTGMNVSSAVASGMGGRDYQYQSAKSADMYRDAIQKQFERDEAQLDTEKKAQLEQADRESRIKQNPYLKGLDPTVITDMAQTQADGTVLDYEDAVERWFKDIPVEQRERAYEAYVTSTKSYNEGLDVAGKNIDLAGKKLDVTQKAILGEIQTEAQATQTVENIQNIINNLKQQKIDNYDISQDKYWNYVNGYLGYRKGVNTLGSSSSSSDSEDKTKNSSGQVGGGASANALAGIGKIGASLNGGGNWGNSSSSGHQSATSSSANVDLLVANGIPTAELQASEWSAKRNEYVQAYNNAIDEQIAYWESTLATTREQMEYLKGKSRNAVNSINDGIVKAPHMAQWIQREDGTRVELNPEDSVYATTKAITSEKDNGSEVIPLQTEDEVEIIQRKLGKVSGYKIVKDFDYYLTKLRQE